MTNLFGTPERVALAMGVDKVSELRGVGELLASLKEPEPPRGLRDAGRLLEMVRALWDMKPALQRRGPCQEVQRERDEIDLVRLPVQHCWPGDVAPLITWGLVVTRGPQSVPRPSGAMSALPQAGQARGTRSVAPQWWQRKVRSIWWNTRNALQWRHSLFQPQSAQCSTGA